MRKLSTREIDLKPKQKKEYKLAAEQCKYIAPILFGLGAYIQEIVANTEETLEDINTAKTKLLHHISYLEDPEMETIFRDQNLKDIPWRKLGIRDIIKRLGETMYVPDQGDFQKAFDSIEGNCRTVLNQLDLMKVYLKSEQTSQQFEDAKQLAMKSCKEAAGAIQLLSRRLEDEGGESWC